ncbi:hypothetical protein LshimejAT787_3200110 [Lyophyllum shimeji]|uniref:N-acetyltransferase domain-containing protein n=1 Tax=Lyophyllum shimeji TaxID=47721 RepID=A0A9P3Q0K9_LYOSH|nr:hypothetical protein LshimejAT787_2200880 [Lyophyllum shimeji]GLB45840.1 hypothetical protein LshimejAT787_3200110 [Lyophyllum shimeji]
MDHQRSAAAQSLVPERPSLFSKGEPPSPHWTKAGLEDDEVFLILALVYCEAKRRDARDKVKKWLNTLLCLDASILPKASTKGTPHSSACELFYFSRDTLFSFHPASKVFFQRMMALYVASDYKNQPNDLQLLSDAP